ncbi:MAG TPA: substrate-binding domain-containing protein [Thermoclostridium sp.]
MKKKRHILYAAFSILIALAGCSGAGQVNTGNNSGTSNNTVFDSSKEITVISRESGSGTRGAFVELLGIEEKDEDGNKKDRTTDEAVISNSTSVVMASVAANPYAIGYISLGSLNDTVKAVKVDGVEATVDNIKNGSYIVSRPFNIATKESVSELAKDFINFILSTEGQKIVEDNGYISVSAVENFVSTKLSGKIVVAGSSSVTPVMEKLKEAYLKVNPNAEIEIQLSDSSTGMNSAINGTCDIGMASRELKGSELEKGLIPTVIAMDGIAVIVNNENPVDNLANEQIKDIYTGKVQHWSEILN